MKIKQIYNLVNTSASEVLGKENVLQEDLTNVVDVGREIENAQGIDAYVKSLVNHIGRVIFVDRVYRGSAPSVLMDGWEFGSILEKISSGIPQATANESWELVDGASYDPNIFYQPKVSAKFFNKRVTFEVPMSFAEKQVKQSFSGAEQLNGFLSMLFNSVEKSMTVALDGLIMKTINNMIGETVYDEYSGGVYTLSSGVRAINLLYLYNQAHSGATISTAEEANRTPEFIRFAFYYISLYSDRMSKISTLFNVGEKERFTPKDLQHIVLLSDFAKAAGVYLYDANGQFNTSNLQLPVKPETVPYWQGSGKTYAFSDVSKVNVVTSENHSVELDGILGVIYDRDALGVCCVDKRTTTAYNAKAEFYTNFAKYDAGYFNDLNENFVVFFAK